MFVLISVLVVSVALLFLVVRWILEPFRDWKQYQGNGNRKLEDCVKWNSDNSDPATLLNHINNPAYQPKPDAAPPRAKTAAAAAPPPLYLSLVVPAYNETRRLESGLIPTLSYLNYRAQLSPAFRYEVIVVDDGSLDDTTQLAIKLSKSVKLTNGEFRIVQLSHNMGKGFATRIGVHCSRGEFILMVDADGATLISDIEKLETALASNHEYKDLKAQKPKSLEVLGVKDICGRTLTARSTEHLLQKPATPSYEIAIGSRLQCLAESDEVIQRSVFRRFLANMFHLIVTWVLGNQIRDTQCGFKLFTRKSARCLFSSLHLHRWAFDVELFVLASKFKFRTVEVPVNWSEVAGSKLNPISAAMQMTRDLIIIKLFYGFGVWRPNWNSLIEPTKEGK